METYVTFGVTLEDYYWRIIWTVPLQQQHCKHKMRLFMFLVHLWCCQKKCIFIKFVHRKTSSACAVMTKKKCQNTWSLNIRFSSLFLPQIQYDAWWFRIKSLKENTFDKETVRKSLQFYSYVSIWNVDQQSLSLVWSHHWTVSFLMSMIEQKCYKIEFYIIS